jgi:hypothetical protein
MNMRFFSIYVYIIHLSLYYLDSVQFLVNVTMIRKLHVFCPAPALQNSECSIMNVLRFYIWMVASAQMCCISEGKKTLNLLEIGSTWTANHVGCNSRFIHEREKHWRLKNEVRQLSASFVYSLYVGCRSGVRVDISSCIDCNGQWDHNFYFLLSEKYDYLFLQLILWVLSLLLILRIWTLSGLPVASYVQDVVVAVSQFMILDKFRCFLDRSKFHMLVYWM